MESEGKKFKDKMPKNMERMTAIASNKNIKFKVKVKKEVN